MLFLSEAEKVNWTSLGDEILRSDHKPQDFEREVRKNLLPVFYSYIGTRLAASGRDRAALDYFKTGAWHEEEGFFFNVFLTSFLERQNHQLKMPAVIFADPRPYVHFTTIPVIKEMRKRFMHCAGNSMDAFQKPFKIMDLGCGNGTLVVDLLKYWQEIEKITDIGEILLVDSSPGMIELASRTVRDAFPTVNVRTVTSRIEHCANQLATHYDVALSSLAYHHMPVATKKQCLHQLRPWFDHFILFEIDANNDTPELCSPELILSIYQSYGRLIDFVFAHDAPVDVAYSCVDCFLMSEVVSFLTQPRGQRTDYHMLRSQWREVFETVPNETATCRCEATCYSDPNLDLFAMHYCW